MADYQGKSRHYWPGNDRAVMRGLFMARGVTPRVMDTRVAPSGLEKLPEEVERYVGA